MKILINSFNNKYYGAHDMAPIACIHQEPWKQWQIFGKDRSNAISNANGNSKDINSSNVRVLWMQ
jgi:hypothetical protein